MGVVIRQSIKATIVSYVGFALGYISVLLLFPYFFKPEEFGLTRIIIAVASIIVQFAHLGMANVTVQFLPHFKGDNKKLGGFFFLAILVSSIGFLISALVLIIFKDKILAAYAEQSPLFVQYYYYVLPVAFCILIAAVIEAFARANFRIVVPVLIRDVFLRLLTMAIIFAFFFGWVNFSGFIKLFVLIYAIPVLLQLIYLKRLKLLHFNPDLKFLDKKLFRQMMSYGFFTMLVGSASMLVGNLDVLMVGSYLGLDAIAIYSVGFYIGSIIEIPTRSLSQIATPIVVKAWKDNDLNKISEMYKKTSLNQTIFGSLLFIGIWANVDNLMHFLPPSYAQGKWVIFFIAVSKLVDMFTGVNSEIIMSSKHYRFNFYIMLILIVLTIITNLIFIPMYGLIGAAIAAAISIFLFNVIKFIFIKAKFHIHPFTKNTFHVIWIPVLAFFAAQLLPTLSNVYIDILVRSVMITVIFFSLILLLKVSDDINKTYNVVVERIKKFI